MILLSLLLCSPQIFLQCYIVPSSLAQLPSALPNQSDKSKMLSLYVLTRCRGIIKFTFIFRDMLQDFKVRKTLKNTCKDDENRLDKSQAECRQKQVVVLDI